ncbi:MAG: L-2-amino-thiazoline-4-carboxylic acid hydrolase [Chitinivibrionales bacterium]
MTGWYAAQFHLCSPSKQYLFTSLKSLYNFDVVEKNNTSIKFNVKNCPFAHALQSMGAPELGKFLCAGDFVVANHFKDTWKFKRTHSHGTDGQCCDHTYMAVESS